LGTTQIRQKATNYGINGRTKIYRSHVQQHRSGRERIEALWNKRRPCDQANRNDKSRRLQRMEINARAIKGASTGDFTVSDSRRVMFALLEKPKGDVDAFAELARLESRRAEIGAATDRLLAALSAIPERERETYRAFANACKTDDTRRIEAALDDWLDVAPKAEHARREYNATLAMRTYGSTMTTFKGEFPNAKAVLVRACQARLKQAMDRAGIVLAQETERLRPEGFTADQIADSPQVRRTAGRVRNLNAILSRIETEEIEIVWKTFAKQLLPSADGGRTG
jgi:hypothetical protein